MRLRNPVPPALLLMFAAFASASSAVAESERFLVGVEGGLFEPDGFSESYDAVYGDTLTPLGARFEWAVAPRFALALSTSFVSSDGEQVAILPGEGPVPTGIETELELNPWHLTAAYRIHPEGPWSGYLGGGLTYLRFDESSEFEENSGSELGFHAAAGVRRTFGRFVVGVEGLYSIVPDAIGESGAAAAFGEDDLGGLAAKLLLGYAF